LTVEITYRVSSSSLSLSFVCSLDANSSKFFIKVLRLRKRGLPVVGAKGLRGGDPAKGLPVVGAKGLRGGEPFASFSDTITCFLTPAPFFDCVLSWFRLSNKPIEPPTFSLIICDLLFIRFSSSPLIANRIPLPFAYVRLGTSLLDRFDRLIELLLLL
jgi:hypothetical protein